MTTPTLPPLPRPYLPTAAGLFAFTADQMRDYAIAAVEAYKASRVPVAWGVPDERPTARQPFLSLLHQLPQDGGIDGRRKTPLYPAMLVPLYRLDDQP
jgi:hypothetical protein